MKKRTVIQVLLIAISVLSFMLPLPVVAKIQVGPPLTQSGRSIPLADIIVQNGHSGDITAVTTDPAGQHIISGGSDRTIRIWSMQTGKLLKILRGHTNEVVGIAYHPGGNFIVSGDTAGDVIIWDVNTGKIQKTIKLKRSSHLKSVALDSTGKSIIISGQRSIVILDFESGNLKRTLTGPNKINISFAAIAIDPKGRFVAAQGDGGNIYIWRLDSGNHIKTLHGHKLGVNALAFAPSGDFLASGSDDNTIKIWALPSGKMVKTLEGHSAAIRSLAIDATDQTLVSGDTAGQIITWDIRSGLMKNSIHAHYAAVNSVAIDPKGIYMITGSADKTIRIGAIKTGELLRTLGGDWASVDSITTNHAGDMVIAGYTDNCIRLWDLRSAKLARVLRGHDALISALAVDPTDRFLASGSWDNTIRIWDLRSGTHLKILRGHTQQVNAVAFDPTGKYLASASDDGSVYLWDINKGTIATRLNGHTDKVRSVVIDPLGQYIISGSYDKTIRIWDLKTGKSIKVLDRSAKSTEFRANAARIMAATKDGERTSKQLNFSKKPEVLISKYNKMWHTASGHEDLIIALAVDPAGRFFVSSSLDLSGKVWDLKTGDLLKTLIWNETPLSMVIDPTGKYVIIACMDGSAKIWDIEKDEPIQVLQPDTVSTPITPEQWVGFVLAGRDNTIAGNAVAMDKKGKYLFLGSQDGTVKVWNTDNNEHLSFLATKDEWLVYTPDGYFDASRHGGDRVLVVKGITPFEIDQFAVRNNRPDIILKRLQLGDSGLIEHFYQQYLKRLGRLGIDEKRLAEDIHAPEAKILDMKQQGKFAHVKFSLKDTQYRLANYNIHVNGVPLFGAYGKPISGMTFTHTEKIELSSGNNKIEVSGFNEQGVESYRALTTADYREPVTSNLYYIGFGVSKYLNGDLNLRFADKDAIDLAAVLERNKAAYNSVHIKTFVNKEVTTETIHSAKELLRNASVDDTVVLFVAGHGVHSRDATATYYYLTYNANVDNLQATAADFDLLEDLLQGIAPRHKLFLIDTCESGGIENDVLDGYLASSSSRGLRPRTARAIVATPKRKGSKPYIFDRDRYIYNNLIRRSGAVVLASSRGNELSYESDSIKNGYFTREIINALTNSGADRNRDGRVSSNELQDSVSGAVAQATHDLQHPTLDRDNLSIKIELPLFGTNSAAVPSKLYRINVQDFGIVDAQTLAARYAPGTTLGSTRLMTMDSLRLIDRTDRIKAILGVKFGVFYSVEGGAPNTRVTVTIKVIHPPTNNDKTGRSTTVDQWNSTSTTGKKTYDGWTFEYDWEMVPGTWTFEFHHDGTKIGEKTFTVYR